MLSNLTALAIFLAALAAVACYAAPESTSSPCCQDKVHQSALGETVYCPARGR